MRHPSQLHNGYLFHIQQLTTAKQSLKTQNDGLVEENGQLKQAIKNLDCELKIQRTRSSRNLKERVNTSDREFQWLEVELENRRADLDFLMAEKAKIEEKLEDSLNRNQQIRQHNKKVHLC